MASRHVERVMKSIKTKSFQVEAKGELPEEQIPALRS